MHEVDRYSYIAQQRIGVAQSLPASRGSALAFPFKCEALCMRVSPKNAASFPRWWVLIAVQRGKGRPCLVLESDRTAVVTVRYAPHRCWALVVIIDVFLQSVVSDQGVRVLYVNRRYSGVSEKLFVRTIVRVGLLFRNTRTQFRIQYESQRCSWVMASHVHPESRFSSRESSFHTQHCVLRFKSSVQIRRNNF